MSALGQLFGEALMPHGYCLRWFPLLLWTHVASDTLIALAYFSIPVAILYYLWRRNADSHALQRYAHLGVLFAAFIVLCGATHAVGIATIWRPIYGQEAVLKFVTALVSIATAIMLVRAMPGLLSMRSAEELEIEVGLRRSRETELLAINAQLSDEIAQRQRAEHSERETQEAYRQLESAMAQMKLMQSRLLRAETMAALGHSVAGIAHEVNTPLATAVTAAASLRMEIHALSAQRESMDPGASARVGQFLEGATEEIVEIENAVMRASRLIRSYKTVAVDQTSLRRRKVLLKTFLEDNVRSVSPRFKSDATRVVVDCDETLSATLEAGALSQVLTILLENAYVHAFPDHQGGNIIVSARQDDDHLVITVQDNGVGMDESIRERIFEPFFTTQADAGGSGLGLDVVKRLMDEPLQGTIRVDSTPGQGSRFELRLLLRTSA